MGRSILLGTLCGAALIAAAPAFADPVSIPATPPAKPAPDPTVSWVVSPQDITVSQGQYVKARVNQDGQSCSSVAAFEPWYACFKKSIDADSQAGTFGKDMRGQVITVTLARSDQSPKGLYPKYTISITYSDTGEKVEKTELDNVLPVLFPRIQQCVNSITFNASVDYYMQCVTNAGQESQDAWNMVNTRKIVITMTPDPTATSANSAAPAN